MITAEESDAMLAKQRADYTRYFRFLDGFEPTDDTTFGAWIDALAKEFGLGVGEAGGVHMHWMLNCRAGDTAEERAQWLGGM